MGCSPHGYEILRRMPVIVASANRGPELAEAVTGICALLPKPFEQDTLTALVATCLAHEHGVAVVGDVG